MIKRDHPLQLGEKVYDLNTEYIYHITAINPDGTVGLAMTDADIRENLLMFDCEIIEDEYDYTTDEPDALYQFVPGLVARDGNDICYEHDTETGWDDEKHDKDEPYYPYYSPYLNEYLLGYEVFTPEEWESR